MVRLVSSWTFRWTVTAKQGTRGHNIISDGWAGAANPHPHQTLHPTPLPKQTHTQKASETLVFPLFDSWSWSKALLELRVSNKNK